MMAGSEVGSARATSRHQEEPEGGSARATSRHQEEPEGGLTQRSASGWASAGASQGIAGGMPLDKMTVLTAQEEIERLEAENVALNEELHKLRFKRMQLRDPEVVPQRRNECVGTTWCLDRESFADSDKVVINSTATHDVDVSFCAGRADRQALVEIRGQSKTLRLHACRNVKVHADSILLGVEMVECEQVVLVIGGEPPSIMIKYCAGVGLLLCEEAMDGKLHIFKSAGVVLSNVPRTLPVMMPADLIKSKLIYTAEVPSYVRSTLNHIRYLSSANVFPLQRPEAPLEDDTYDEEVWEGEGVSQTRSRRSWNASSAWSASARSERSGGHSLRRSGTGQSRVSR